MTQIKTTTSPPSTGGTSRGAPAREFAPVAAAPEIEPDTVAPLVLRLTLAAAILPHGLQKVFGLFGGPGLSGTFTMFEDAWQIPAYLTAAVIAAEFLGSLGLIAGLLTRLSAIGIAAVMIGAISLVHWEHGFFMNWSGQKAGEGFEYHLLAIGIAIAIVIRGPGRLSIDHWRHRRRATA